MPAGVRPRRLASVDVGACRVTVARSVEEVEALRDTWASVPGDYVHTDPDYFLWSLGEERHVIRPHVLAVEREGRAEAIVAARIADARLPCRLGRFTVYAPTVRALCVMHDGLLGRVDPDIAAAILDELLAALDRREADVVLVRQLQRGSIVHRAAMARAPFSTRQQYAALSGLRWQIDLPETMDEYLASVSSSTRKGVRRTASRVEQHFAERLSIRAFGEPSGLDVLFRDVEAVAARTYQRRLGVGYLGDDREQARLGLLAARGWLRAYVLYLDECPIAFELGEVYGGRFNSLAGAYDPAYGHERVGAYLLLKAIEDLAADRDVSLFDFGFGDAEYKRKLGHRSLEEGDLVIYARRPRPLLVNLVRTTLLELSRGVRTTLARLALLERVRHWSRRPVAAASPARPTA